MKKLLSFLIVYFTFFISYSQNVGIGTTTPVHAKLVVNGVAGNGSTSAIFGSDGTGISLQRNWPTIGFNQYRDTATGYGKYIANGYAAIQYLDPGSGMLSFDFFPNGTANAEASSTSRALQLSPAGNIGIGGASANSYLQFPNTINNRKLTLWEAANNPYQYYGFGIQSGTLTYNVGGTSNRHLFLAGNGANASIPLMSVIGNQKVAIGTYNGVGKLGINHEDPGYTITLMQADHTGLQIVDANTYNSWELKTEMVGGPNYLFFIYRDNFGNVVGGPFIDNNGSYHSASDYRLKKNILEMPAVLPSLLQLHPALYNMKNDPGKKKCIGLIAQELKQFFPELVTVVDGPTAGYKDIKDLHTINYGGLGVLAIKAIQEQEMLIEKLQKQYEALATQLELNKAANEALKNENNSIKKQLEELKQLILSKR